VNLIFPRKCSSIINSVASSQTGVRRHESVRRRKRKKKAEIRENEIQEEDHIFTSSQRKMEAEPTPEEKSLSSPSSTLELRLN
jgi:hypothetical protein